MDAAMMDPGPMTRIGEIFEDLLILARSGDEYLGCKFLRCEVMYEAGAKFYDCEFGSCVIHVNRESGDV